MDKKFASILFSAFLMIVFIYTAWTANEFTRLAKYFPFYISIIGALFCFLYTLIQIKNWRKAKKQEGDREVLRWRRPLIYTCWLLGYVLLIYIAGLMAATAVFLGAFLYYESKIKLWKTAATTAFVLVAVNVFSMYMNLYWPDNLLGW
ncbi:tripartite tricarboxylate transporter TctB family protein [Alteribacillus sp. HJP-4]|uniref:tripartite tricarboxylate transporter TctB family protein n=1 Tax=Alteribacillus sp. HJP-4 TaxID=2775394 RepID=UPI0035CCC95F